MNNGRSLKLAATLLCFCVLLPVTLEEIAAGRGWLSLLSSIARLSLILLACWIFVWLNERKSR